MGREISATENVLGDIEVQLGPPAYRQPGALVYCADCLGLMKRLKGSPVDLTLTSPPYNIGKEYERVMGIQRYVHWCREWIAQVHRLTQPAGALWLNVGYLSVPKRAKALPIAYLLWDHVPFYLIQEIVWNYGAGVAARRSFSPRNEKFLWYVKNPSKYTFHLDAVRDPHVKYRNQKKMGRLRCNPLGKNPTDVWQIPKVTSGNKRSSRERTPHPAQFPAAVVERIIMACTDPGDLVFDPFLGSGTVAEVALRNGRLALGVEIQERYVEIVAKRLAGLSLQTQAGRPTSSSLQLIEDQQLALFR